MEALSHLGFRSRFITSQRFYSNCFKRFLTSDQACMVYIFRFSVKVWHCMRWNFSVLRECRKILTVLFIKCLSFNYHLAPSISLLRHLLNQTPLGCLQKISANHTRHTLYIEVFYFTASETTSIYLIVTYFRGHLISRKEQANFARLIHFAIWQTKLC